MHCLPGPNGIAAAVLGLGDDRSPFAFGGLALRLPEGSTWQLQPGDYDPAAAILGFALGAYRYTELKQPERAPARLVAPENPARSAVPGGCHLDGARPDQYACQSARADRTGGAAAALGRRYGAEVTVSEGAELDAAYPTVAAVGRGSARPPRVVTLRWRGSSAHADAPLVSLCGKGVCFDTGGYDLKPSSAMLRMKKDMGGAACVLGLARMIMEADLPIRLEVRVGCVENSGPARRCVRST